MITARLERVVYLIKAAPGSAGGSLRGDADVAQSAADSEGRRVLVAACVAALADTELPSPLAIGTRDPVEQPLVCFLAWPGA